MRNIINKKAVNSINKQSVGILYIATGRYIVFWKKFYKYCEKYFLKDFSKTYYLFTDNKINVKPNVKLINIEKFPWPYIALYRYDIFLNTKEELIKNDYLYFINANMLPVREVGIEIMPSSKQKLIATIHPAFYKNDNKFTYDRNPLSCAYIKEGMGEHYYQSCFTGGIAEAYLKMCETCSDWTHKDLKNKIIALWHDESYFNKFMINKHPLILSPQYAFPEDMPWNKSSLGEFKNNYKILIQDKAKWGGHSYLRSLNDMPYKNNKVNKFKYLIKKIIKK